MLSADSDEQVDYSAFVARLAEFEDEVAASAAEAAQQELDLLRHWTRFERK